MTDEAATLDEEFAAFLDGTLSPEAWARRLWATARAECPECDRRLTAHEGERAEERWFDRDRWPLPGGAAEESFPGGAAEEPPPPAWPGAGDRDPAAAGLRQSLANLARLRRRAQGDLVGALRRLRHPVVQPGVVPLLLLKGRRQLDEKPKVALAWFDCAVAVARLLPANAFRPRWLVRARAARAGALQAAGRLAEAAEEWVEIETTLAHHPLPGPEEEAALWLQAADLRAARRDAAGAELRLERARRLFEGIGGRAADGAGVAEVLNRRGELAERAGDLPAALDANLRAAAALEPETEPRLHWTLHARIAELLARLGRTAEARRALDAAYPYYHRVGDADLRTRQASVEATIALAQGRHAVARGHLEQVIYDCQSQNRACDFVLALLDLAAVHLAARELEPLPRIAALVTQALPQARPTPGIRQALARFAEEVAAGTAGADRVAELRRYLPLAWLDPTYELPG